MKHDVVAPSVGESITEVTLLKWTKNDGEQVEVGDMLLEIESDKATVEVVAESAGALKILKQEGEQVNIGEKIAEIDDAATGSQSAAQPQAPAAKEPESVAPVQAISGGAQPTVLSPAVRKAVVETGVDPQQIRGTGKDGRLTKGDVLSFAQAQQATAAASVAAPAAAPASSSPAPSLKLNPGDRRVPMSRIRQKIAERLVQAQQTAAILTTFNECNMAPVMELRKKYKDAFKEKNGVPLSFMSFFTRATVEALKLIPEVNASIEGTDMIYHDYQDIGIAVGTDRGLVVPVLRNAGTMGFVEIEKGIGELAKKARNGKLSIADMTGGTFTISNGGVYGSMMSTPILNPPQSGILGLHNIQERPQVVDGKIEARPMMYLAVSYDHRIIDGKEAVTFLVHIKDYIENPEKLGLEFVNEL